MYPSATYRLQFHRDFGFDAAAALAPYLAQLGITHVYASPYLKARPGSQHGYDIVAHDQLNPELGDAAAFERMVMAFKQNDLRQLLDIVPNHMGVGGADNPLWLSVLEWGQESSYSGWFDIDWEPDQQYLRSKLLVPLLGNQYGAELENGQLVLRFDAHAGDFAVWAYDTHKLPICPLHYALILENSHPELEYLGDDFSALAEWRPHIERRAAELKAQLAKLVGNDTAMHSALQAALDRINAHGAAPLARPALHQLIKLQHWRAAHFRVAGDDINYRRFFNINDLAGIRVELPDVFEHSHRLILKLYAAGIVDGLRVDHIDGLLDPAAYLQRLSAAASASRQDTASNLPPYIVVEKVLTGKEHLQAEWPVAGTTGYEAGNALTGLLIDPASEQLLSDFYTRFTGERTGVEAVVRACKLQIMNNDMAGELNVIARDAARIARQSPHTADFTKNVLLRAIKAWVACFGMYRTYIDSRGQLRSEDLELIDAALQQARAFEREIDPSVFDFLKQLLHGELLNRRGEFVRHAVLRCAMKLQQYSGPVMAKGLEDTAFYRYNRFIALNEVGGDPRKFGTSISEFHDANLYRAQHWPYSLLCTSSHDTKRGEDARARLAALSEVAQEWCKHVTQWQSELQTGVTQVVARSDMYMLYQLIIATLPADLVGAPDQHPERWHEYAERVKVVVQKSVREAKQHSTWAAPEEAYEEALRRIVDMILLGDRSTNFHRSFFAFQADIACLGVHNSLVQTTLKLLMPGVPDIYQGSELWNLDMVDPDNRRPVDFELRRHLLLEIQNALTLDRKQAMQNYFHEWRTGRIKLALTYLLLDCRRRHINLLNSGSYLPCIAQGPRAHEIVAFLRYYDGDAILVVARRFPGRQFDRVIKATDVRLEIPEEWRSVQWHDVLTNSIHHAHRISSPQALFHTLPVAVLTSHRLR